MGGMTMHGTPNSIFGWDGARAYLAEDVAAGTPAPAQLGGAAAAIQTLPGGRTAVFRDRLGLAKLFWARGRDPLPAFAALPIDLIRAGFSLDDIMAVPRGIRLDFDRNGIVRETKIAPPKGRTDEHGPSLETVARRIRAEVGAYLGAIAAAYPGRRAYVCLSGGLDSSTIAVLAREHFANLTAISFDIAHPARPPSDDRIAARHLARDLGMPLVEATVTPDELLSLLDTVLVAGVDWRDFNVHCALVNAALGRVTAEESRNDPEPPLAITGDLSNEYLVDYKEEKLHGATYYALPRVAPTRLRDILVHGLDTCHREVGVFEAFGIPVVQPYAVAVDAYLDLPPSFLAMPDRKDRLVQAVVGDALPDYIYSRPKVRAQTGGVDPAGGVLGTCVTNGIDAAWLKRRFAELHDASEDALDRFIRGGRYRAAVPSLEEFADA